MTIDLGWIVPLLPSCATACLVSAIQNSTCAGRFTDGDCICPNQALNDAARICILAECTVKEALSTQNLTSTACGVQPTVNTWCMPVGILFATIAFIAVCLRFLARMLVGLHLWWDDFFNLISMASVIAYISVLLGYRSLGFGTDIWAVSFDNITRVLQMYYGTFFVYVVSRSSIRISNLFFYLRIFRSTQGKPYILGSLAFEVGILISYFFTCIFQCNPISYFWLRWDGEHDGRCINERAMVWSSAIITICFDVWVILLPIPHIYRLNLTLRKKILATVMFALGSCSIAISLSRLRYIDPFTTSSNPTLDTVGIAIFSTLEVELGIILSCLPSIQALLTPGRMKKTIWGSSAASRSANHGEGSFNPKAHRNLGSLQRPPASFQMSSRSSQGPRNKSSRLVNPSESETRLRQAQDFEMNVMSRGASEAVIYAHHE